MDVAAPASKTSTASSGQSESASEFEQPFEGEDQPGPAVSSQLADYVSQCASRRISKDKLADLKSRFPRPENCKALVVPKVNQCIWSELDKRYQAIDVHMQGAQDLVTRGVSAVVVAKELLQPSGNQVSETALAQANKALSTAIALLGNGGLELSHRRREVMHGGINKRYLALCDSSVPVTSQLFVCALQPL